MPNQQGPHNSAHALSTAPSFGGLNTSYSGRESYALRERPLQVVRINPPMPLKYQKPLGPDAIWGQYNNYRSNGLMGSAVAHVVALALIIGGSLLGHKVVPRVEQHETVTLIAPSPDSYALPVAKQVVSGGGGGGEHDPLPAPKGRLPKIAMQQITPPTIIIHNLHPKLAVEPTVVVPPQVRVAENHMPNLGVPTAAPMPSAPPSNGTGSGAGIGSGSGGGVGVGHGPGVGAGSGGGIGGGVFKVGGGISAPQPLATPDPEYTEQARQAKTQGTCILWMIVDDQGHPRDIRVVRGLGFGLDAKAIDAVKQWRFQPAMKDGRPVNVQISVEVGFRLY
ncbi:MAG: energy transducer TonB [Candidatus Sulfotelmatobacter sp.]